MGEAEKLNLVSPKIIYDFSKLGHYFTKKLLKDRIKKNLTGRFVKF